MKMTVEDLYGQVEIQGEVKIVYVEQDGYSRIEIDYECAQSLEIQYMYCDDGVLYIEVEYEI